MLNLVFCKKQVLNSLLGNLSDIVSVAFVYLAFTDFKDLKLNSINILQGGLTVSVSKIKSFSPCTQLSEDTLDVFFFFPPRTSS